MKLEYISAFLLFLFLMTISVPNLFADQHRVNNQNGYFENSVNHSQLQRISDIEEENDPTIRRKSADVISGNIARFGMDLLKVSDVSHNYSEMTLRTGLSSLSKNAAAGVQLIVSW